ncbi:MAG: cytochrome c oxidase subunit 3 family protein [Deltaproteobacteria bacterium]|nr:MAG: cytochrome c oxidase subunit 3 family protein [Deltaproteobacteria bacterium]
MNEKEERRDNTSSRMGMWLFLLSEVLLFGGMFILYSAYRYRNASDFHHASGELDLVLGTFNTLILLTSSLTMAVSVSAIQRGNRRLSAWLLATTLFFGLFFLLNKGIEWSTKIHHGIYPDSPVLLQRRQGEALFFALYYVMTGLHGLHVLVGVVLLAVMFCFVIRMRITQTRFASLENSGLYWHLVDIIWIFLFPLFYLIA